MKKGCKLNSQNIKINLEDFPHKLVYKLGYFPETVAVARKEIKKIQDMGYQFNTEGRINLQTAWFEFNGPEGFNHLRIYHPTSKHFGNGIGVKIGDKKDFKRQSVGEFV